MVPSINTMLAKISLAFFSTGSPVLFGQPEQLKL